MADTGTVVLFIVIFLVVVSILVYIVYLFRSSIPQSVKPDSILIINTMPELSDGHFELILDRIHEDTKETDGRILLEVVTRDNEYVNGVMLPPKRLSFPIKKEWLKTINRGVWSQYRTIAFIIPDRPDELPESLLNDPVGKMFANVIENSQNTNNEIVSLKRQIKLMGKLMKEDPTGEYVDYLIEKLGITRLDKQGDEQQKPKQVTNMAPQPL